MESACSHGATVVNDKTSVQSERVCKHTSLLGRSLVASPATAASVRSASYLVVVVHLHHVPLAVAHAAGDVGRNRGLGLAWQRVKTANTSAKREGNQIAKSATARGKKSHLQSR